MHFRHVILMGIFLGASAFFPSYALANGAENPSEPKNSPVQTLVSEKIKNPVASEKAMPVSNENVHKGQDGVVENPAANPSHQQSIPNKPVSNLPNKVNTGNEKAPPSLEKKSMADESAEQAAKVKNTEHMEPAKPDVVENKVPEVSAPNTSNQTDLEVKMDKPPNRNGNLEKVIEDGDSSESIKTSSSLSVQQFPNREEANKGPSNDKRISWDDEMINTPPQRTTSFGGQSDAQFSSGTGTMSFIANRVHWGDDMCLTLGQIYISRQRKFCHQWINAPPSPPPKAAPFILLFTANLANGNYR
ncbi:hypothetical protein [Neobacillus sp. Marseille-QA0830]